MSFISNLNGGNTYVTNVTSDNVSATNVSCTNFTTTTFSPINVNTSVIVANEGNLGVLNTSTVNTSNFNASAATYTTGNFTTVNASTGNISQLTTVDLIMPSNGAYQDAQIIKLNNQLRIKSGSDATSEIIFTAHTNSSMTYDGELTLLSQVNLQNASGDNGYITHVGNNLNIYGNNNTSSDINFYTETGGTNKLIVKRDSDLVEMNNLNVVDQIECTTLLADIINTDSIDTLTTNSSTTNSSISNSLTSNVSTSNVSTLNVSQINTSSCDTNFSILKKMITLDQANNVSNTAFYRESQQYKFIGNYGDDAGADVDYIFHTNDGVGVPKLKINKDDDVVEIINLNVTDQVESTTCLTGTINASTANISTINASTFNASNVNASNISVTNNVSIGATIQSNYSRTYSNQIDYPSSGDSIVTYYDAFGGGGGILYPAFRLDSGTQNNYNILNMIAFHNNVSSALRKIDIPAQTNISNVSVTNISSSVLSIDESEIWTSGSVLHIQSGTSSVPKEFKFATGYPGEVVWFKNNSNGRGTIETHDINVSTLSVDGLDITTGKQNTLTAGTNITIDANNVISSSGGGGTSSNQLSRMSYYSHGSYTTIPNGTLDYYDNGFTTEYNNLSLSFTNQSTASNTSGWLLPEGVYKISYKCCIDQGTYLNRLGVLVSFAFNGVIYVPADTFGYARDANNIDKQTVSTEFIYTVPDGGEYMRVRHKCSRNVNNYNTNWNDNASIGGGSLIITRIDIVDTVPASNYVGGNGINITNNIISIDTDPTITGTVNADGLSIAPNTDLTTSSVIGRLKINTLFAGDNFVLSHYDRSTTTDYALIQTAAGFTILNSPVGQGINLNIGDATKLRVHSSGRIGIGTVNPQAPLHIAGWTTGNITQNSTNGGYLLTWNGLPKTNFGSQQNNVTIYAAGNAVFNTVFVGYDIAFSSDRRIKTDIEDINDDEALNMLRNIKPKKYKYIDKTRSTNTVIGFIAQDIETDLPEAHKTTINSVPNFYQVGQLTNKIYNDDGELVTATVSYETDVVLEYDDSGNLYNELDIRTLSSTENKNIVTIISIDNKTIEISGNIEHIPDTDEVWLYGQQVNNFNTIKKDYIFTVNVAATQEIDRQLQAEKAKVAALETQLADVLTRLQNAGI